MKIVSRMPYKARFYYYGLRILLRETWRRLRGRKRQGINLRWQFEAAYRANGPMTADEIRAALDDAILTRVAGDRVAYGWYDDLPEVIYFEHEEEGHGNG